MVQVKVEGGKIVIEPVGSIATKYYASAKIKQRPEDLDEFFNKAVRKVGKRKYVDVNVFVYWIGGHPRYGQKALKLKEIEAGNRGELITSILTACKTMS